MGDRRIADRRSPEKGVIKVQTKDVILTLLILISLIFNLILVILYSNTSKLYKDAIDSLNSDYTIEDEDVLDLSDIDTDEDADDDEGTSEYTCDLSIVGDKEQIKAGETLIYTVSAENIDAGEGITLFETFLNYDENSFNCEVLADEDSEWSQIGVVENYITMNRKDLSPNYEDQKIVRIALTAKENIQPGEQTISFEKIKFTADEDKTFTLPDENITINVLNN